MDQRHACTSQRPSSLGRVSNGSETGKKEWRSQIVLASDLHLCQFDATRESRESCIDGVSQRCRLSATRSLPCWYPYVKASLSFQCMESGSTKMAPSWKPVAPLLSSTDRPLPPLHDGADFLHHTVTCDSAALALAVDTQRARMLVGMQSGEICAWDLDTFQPCARLIGHRSSVLSLILVDDYLFSASSDSTVRIWDAPL